MSKNLKILDKYLSIERNRKLFKKVRKEFEERGPIAHNWDHIYRDLINAIWIGEEESADMDIVFPAVLLHDVGFLYDPDPDKHHKVGAKNCTEWLQDWTKSDIEEISKCILRHKGSFMGFKNEPETLEEKVVYDADQLEKFGFAGFAGCVRVGDEFAQSTHPEFKSLYELAKVFQKVREIKLYTTKAKSMAKKRGGMKFGLFKKIEEELKDYYI